MPNGSKKFIRNTYIYPYRSHVNPKNTGVIASSSK